MNFDLSEDEEMFKALAERFVADHYDADTRRGFLNETNGFSASNWALLGELGLLAAPYGEDAGGLDLDGTALATICEALGRGLVVEPYVEAVLAAGRLFAATANADLAAEWVPSLVMGEKRLAIAHLEPDARAGLLRVATTVAADGDGVVISGNKSPAMAGQGADGYIVTARRSGAPDSTDGVEMWFVPADAAGLTVTGWRVADGSYAVTLDLAGVRLPASHRLAGDYAAFVDAERVADLGRAAEAIGIMEAMLAETCDYLRTRKQFGVALATFQAIQHRMVAQYVALEKGRALLNLAIVEWGKPGFARAVAGVRAYLCQAVLPFGHEMIQFHGGMGVTEELSIGQGHKRLMVLSRWPSMPDAALDAYIGLAA